ncbi:Pre-mRNA-splicing factor cwc24 [Fulvia fulva]|uniref:Pre-mRNA-splicing factor CWC24 n=1 Tax=Passalora fulva TaxID=5499 RepID=A0A9Q8P8V4_PASFU|nr:Pre-mRNA-splicing factor cwc24 [Fulvia fulva]KAK4624333.1 Pre-mRNA-splicing factor cwc24 [Fulvia fulva]KAK4624933.1 Pre-mRNA-splicing factor cwc24 [Fulvia fulva]UJO17640.1 Pre-mRNA-splicing factor cwc24 [Fulvia fulva]WPV14737.1 Pre-mRNA-splicing factor cwc24 [Fulvia fulva]WPV29487.1 Pre-mRNA-splicing factor cwc24 [Fulvia fulva]
MADVAAPVFKKRANKGSNIRKRPATPPPEESGSDSDYTDDEAGVRIKRRKKEGVTVGTGPKRQANFNKNTNFEADRSKTIADNEDATKASNWYTDAALAAKDAPSTTVSKTETVVPGATDGKYQGTAKYSTFIQKHPDHEKKVGPVKAPTNVRAITVTDFAPDVCKDYKQTGFCGFGDSCKFLHAREDYKQGWQLDKEWEKVGSKKDKPGQNGKEDTSDMTEEEKMLMEIPFACIICKESYKNPVVTKCGHYFCEKCAMGRYMKEKRKTCANCGADTGGSFGIAKKLKGLLEKKKKREEERAEKEANEGDDDA